MEHNRKPWNRSWSRLTAVAWALAATLTGTSLRSALADRAYQINPDQSRALIAVGKAGVLSFAGHTHEVAAPVAGGLVTLDAADLAHSTLRLEIDASALRVTGKGEPAADVPAVQQTMLSDKVLDVGRYPTIVFSSTSVSVEKRSGSAADLVIAGRLTLHGVTGSLKVPVHVELAGGDADRTGSISSEADRLWNHSRECGWSGQGQGRTQRRIHRRRCRDRPLSGRSRGASRAYPSASTPSQPRGAAR